MTEDKNKRVEEQEEAEVITLEFDEGEPVDCEIMGIFDFEGKDYIALIPDDGSDDVWLYGYIEDDDSTNVIPIFKGFEVDKARTGVKIEVL